MVDHDVAQMWKDHNVNHHSTQVAYIIISLIVLVANCTNYIEHDDVQWC